MSDVVDVQIRLSGKVEVVRDGDPVALPGLRARALLVMLALSAGRTVPVETLAHGIWGEDPPERVRGSLQTYVGRLRQAIGADAVVTEPAGYRFDVPSDTIDLLRFERLAAGSGAEAPADEARRLDEALSLWAGDPFGGAPSEWIERQLVPELTERYLQTVERRVDLAIGANDSSAWLPQLRNLIERHPLRETLWARLLNALESTGRTAEALERYDALRVVLAGELGVDPSPEVQRIYHDLLATEAPRADAGQRRDAPTPRQLPRAIAGFTGRSEQLAYLEAAMTDDDSPLIALHGPGGVGKTALAVYWASRGRDRFPDGQLFVDLRGYGPGEQVDPLEALDALLRGFGVPGSQIPADTESRSAVLRTELSERRVLVVLDNARGAAQVRPLLAGGSTTTVVTSRSQLRGLASREGARRIAVGPMPVDDARTLLANRFGIATTDHAEELADLAELCGRLPVALAVAAERAGRDGRPRIVEVNERLRDERNRLSELTDWADDPLTDVRAAFSWSYQLLDSETARLFRLLGRHPHPRIAIGAAAALAGVEPRAAERLLDRLVERHLLTEVSLGWYELHDLSHAYAAELAATEPDESAAAVQRLRSWYLHSVRNARSAFGAQFNEYDIAEPDAGVTPVQFESKDLALRWVSVHHESIRAMVNAAASDGDDRIVSWTTPYLFTFLRRRGALRELVDMLTLAHRSARRIAATDVEATCTRLLGTSLQFVGDLDEALRHQRAAVELYIGADDAKGRLAAELSVGVTLSILGREEEAIATYERSLTADGDADTSRVRVMAVNNLATLYLRSGRVDDAIDSARRAVDLGRSTRVELETAATNHVTLGEAYLAHRRWAEATEALMWAVSVFRDASAPSGEIVALKHLGLAHRGHGESAAARADWTAAIERLDELEAETVPYGANRDELSSLLAELPAKVEAAPTDDART